MERGPSIHFEGTKCIVSGPRCKLSPPVQRTTGPVRVPTLFPSIFSQQRVSSEKGVKGSALNINDSFRRHTAQSQTKVERHQPASFPPRRRARRRLNTNAQPKSRTHPVQAKKKNFPGAVQLSRGDDIQGSYPRLSCTHRRTIVEIGDSLHRVRHSWSPSSRAQHGSLLQYSYWC